MATAARMARDGYRVFVQNQELLCRRDLVCKAISNRLKIDPLAEADNAASAPPAKRGWPLGFADDY